MSKDDLFELLTQKEEEEEQEKYDLPVNEPYSQKEQNILRKIPDGLSPDQDAQSLRDEEYAKEIEAMRKLKGAERNADDRGSKISDKIDGRKAKRRDMHKNFTEAEWSRRLREERKAYIIQYVGSIISVIDKIVDDEEQRYTASDDIKIIRAF